MRVCYGTPWIEIEYGWTARPFGWQLFSDLEQAIRVAKEGSARGNDSHDGYMGPVRPLTVVEIPYESLEDSIAKSLEMVGHYHTDDFWRPEFTGKIHKVE